MNACTGVSAAVEACMRRWQQFYKLPECVPSDRLSLM